MDRTSSASSANVFSTPSPIYMMPWKAVAIGVTGVAVLTFMAMTFSVPSLMPLSKYSLSYVLFGIGCLAKAWSVFKHSRGEAQFKFAETLNEADAKKNWMQQASDNGYAPAMREYAAITGDQGLMIQAARNGDETAKKVIAELSRMRDGMFNLTYSFNWLKSLNRQTFNDDYIAKEIIARVKEAQILEFTEAKIFVNAHILSFNFKQETIDKIKKELGPWIGS